MQAYRKSGFRASLVLKLGIICRRVVRVTRFGCVTPKNNIPVPVEQEAA
jgi:hypothetical protein